MALTYKNAGAAIGTSYATVYTCPASTAAVVTLAQVANVDGTNSATVEAQWLDDSNADAAIRISPVGLTVSAQTAINLLDNGPVNLEAGDQFQAKASASGDIEITLAIIEIT
jgi:hypothetical protein